MGRSVAAAVVAGLFAAGPAWADGSDWKPPVPQPAQPAPAMQPAAAAPADDPGWNPTRPDGPRWVAGTAPQPPDTLPGTTVPMPQLPAKPDETPQKPESVPAPRPITPPRNGNGGPRRDGTRLAPPATQPPAAMWGEPPAECPPALEPAPCGLGPATVPIRHKTFGSPSLTLSRDYHFLDLFGLSMIGGEEGETVVLTEAPATDRYFVQAEYLMWWVRRGNIPVLASTAPEPAGPGGNFGFLGQPGTSVLLGPGPFGDSFRSGFRFRTGAWLEDGCGVDGSFFFLGRRTDSFTVNSGLFPVIARPIFVPNVDPVTGQVIGEFAQVVAGGGTTGALRVEQTSQLWGADINFRSCICRTCSESAEWFVGYRHLNLREDLTTTEAIVAGPLDAPQVPGTRITVQDQFKTRNQFHGGQVGYAVSRKWGRFDVDARASVALGVTHQELDIAGFQAILPPGQQTPAVFNGGLLAVGPNLGRFTNNKFSVAPETTVNVGYMVTPNVRAYIGYNFLYWTNVIRPGDQIDRVVDLTFVPNSRPVAFSGQNRPQPLFKQSDLWAQGLQFGIELRW
jgi:hypothetical protein